LTCGFAIQFEIHRFRFILLSKVIIFGHLPSSFHSVACQETYSTISQTLKEPKQKKTSSPTIEKNPIKFGLYYKLVYVCIGIRADCAAALKPKNKLNI